MEQGFLSNAATLPAAFYARDPVAVARDLKGKLLAFHGMGGFFVET